MNDAAKRLGKTLRQNSRPNDIRPVFATDEQLERVRRRRT